LYISVDVHNAAYLDNVGNEINFPPVHFSEDDVMPLVPAGIGIAHEGYKTGFLLKFDKDTGDLLWRKDLQGLVTQSKRAMSVGRIFIDSNDVIHQIVGLQEGTHLDGLVTVEEEDIKYFLVKYDTNGSILGTPQELPMTGNGFAPRDNIFLYDEVLNRYYIAGTLKVSFSYEGIPLSYASNGRFYILTFDGDTFDELWRKEIVKESGIYGEELRQVVIDEDANIYLAGIYTNSSNALEYFGDYLLPQSIGTYTFGYMPFAMKLNSNGDVQWIRTPDGYTADVASTGTIRYNSITLNGNELAITPNSSAHIWGDFSIVRPVPNNHQQDPVLLRLDKETGEVIGLHDVMGLMVLVRHLPLSLQIMTVII
jgi:outer membrane protein assembly factor BamB